MHRWLSLVSGGVAVVAAVAQCGRKSTPLLEHKCDELLQLTPTRLCLLPETFQMLWPSTTTNYGGRGMQIASL